ncbi:MAG TPA: DUF5941 domain-containing protein, partial [Micromonospora sp.]
GVADLPALAEAARSVADGGGSPGSALDRLVVALAATGTTIFAHRVRLLVARRVVDRATAAEAERAVAAVDSDKAELRLAVKERDDFFTTYFVSTWSPWVTKACARIGLGPTGVTVLSVLMAVAAAGLFALGGRPALVTGAVLLYLGFVLDCVDGQLARYTRDFSPWGGWLDTMADRAKEYVVYAGLGWGVTRAGLDDGWPVDGWTLAIAAITLQTVRHMTDTWYGALHDEAARRPKPAGAGAGGIGDRLSRASNRVQSDTGSVSYWLKRTVVFPIGERWALISLTVALFDPLVSLLAVLAWGVLAFGYTLALRTLRARSMRVPVMTGVDRPLHRDDGRVAGWLGWIDGRVRAPLTFGLVAALTSVGLLGSAVAGAGGAGSRWYPLVALPVLLLAGLPSRARHDGPLDWLVPAVLRAAEYLFVIAYGVFFDLPGALVYALLFVLALRHYDLTARLEKRQGAAPLHALGLGWDGRLILLAVVGAVGFGILEVTVGLTAYLFGTLAVGAVVGWSTVAAGRRRSNGVDDAVAAPDDMGRVPTAEAVEEQNR